MIDGGICSVAHVNVIPEIPIGDNVNGVAVSAAGITLDDLQDSAPSRLLEHSKAIGDDLHAPQGNRFWDDRKNSHWDSRHITKGDVIDQNHELLQTCPYQYYSEYYDAIDVQSYEDNGVIVGIALGGGGGGGGSSSRKKGNNDQDIVVQTLIQSVVEQMGGSCLTTARQI